MTPIEKRPTQIDPFACGLPRRVVLRLLNGTHTHADRALYYRSDWWAAQKAACFEHHGRFCVLCDAPAAQVHHRPAGYRNLFRENPRKHLVPLCRTCHKRHHRR